MKNISKIKIIGIGLGVVLCLLLIGFIKNYLSIKVDNEYILSEITKHYKNQSKNYSPERFSEIDTIYNFQGEDTVYTIQHSYSEYNSHNILSLFLIFDINGSGSGSRGSKSKIDLILFNIKWKKINIISIEEGKLDGEFIEYRKDGKMRLKINYKAGKLDGEYIEYREDGKSIIIKGNYKQNQEDGEWIGHHENGQVRFKDNYKEGKKVGEWIIYDEEGKIRENGEYSEGKKVGEWVEFDGAYKINSKGNYREGKKVGEWIFYDEQGNETKRKTY